MAVNGVSEDTIFEQALARPAGEREPFLRTACGNDAAQYSRILALLRGHQKAERFLNAPIAARPLAALAAEEKRSEQIGRYTLLEKLGEGGCGVVWRAEQREPVRREVALKVIKLGMDTREVIARFEAERQALALMDHPNIARVFDGGATASGRPYFVMELVRGVPITRYCDEHGLGLRERLELFITVCDAVQHAHQKGIIHRDLKPSNILVSEVERVSDVAFGSVVPNALSENSKPAAWGPAFAQGYGRAQQAAPPSRQAVPKVIDFGIAKATQGRLTDATLHTAVHQFIGTPAYVSPEQVGHADVDTRSDLYSLGVLLYELLTGETPLDRATLASSTYDEIREKIRTLDPVRPSARVRMRDVARASRPCAETSAPVRSRAGRPCHSALAAQLRGDLDAIVMCCLEKDPARRYASAAALALDLRRHLDHEPVSVRAPSSAYRLRKLIRRHRAVFASIAVVATVLVAAVVVVTWQAGRARQAEQEQARLRNEMKAIRVAKTEPAGPPARSARAEKSIAVLPFANLSVDQDSAFFADGVHEDIVASLYLIPDLKVVSRTSVLQYRGTTKTTRLIGEELGVAYVLEGSVRRAGDQVRVTSQLINARTDHHVWAKTYDKKLTEVFAIQSELAQAIAAELEANLSPRQKHFLEQRPTENATAYDLFLRARELWRTTTDEAGQARRESDRFNPGIDVFLETALRLDPNFAAAWGRLCEFHAFRYEQDYDVSGERNERALAKARSALDAVQRLAPDSPTALRTRGYFCSAIEEDYACAEQNYARLVQLQPNDPEVNFMLAWSRWRQKRWGQAIESLQTAIQLDPDVVFQIRDLLHFLELGRRFHDAQAWRRRLARLQPAEVLRQGFESALDSFRATGSTREGATFIASLSASDASSADAQDACRQWALITGDSEEYLRLMAGKNGGLDHALGLLASGENGAARELLTGEAARLRSELGRTPNRWQTWVALAEVEVLLGRKAEALRCVDKCPVLNWVAHVRAFIYAWSGDKERALAEYARLLRTVGRENVHVMKRHPRYAPLQGDARFEALLNDPKNNQPLF